MNVFLREIKAYRKSTIIWTISLSLLVILFLSIYPSFTKDVEATKASLANLPEAVRNALNISFGTFFTVAGFYSYLMTFVILAGAIQAMNIGTGIISKEITDQTVDFLLTKPIARARVVTYKILAALCLLIFTNIVFVLTSFITAQIVSKASFGSSAFILISLTLFFVQLAFLALGLLFSVAFPRIKSVIAVSLPTVFAFYIISTLGAILGNAEVRYITPFKFFDTNYIIIHKNYEIRFMLIELVFIVIAVAATYAIYKKRDIRSFL